MPKKSRYVVWCFVALVLACFVGAGVWVMTRQSALDVRLADLRAAGEPVTFPDLARPNGSPDDNAALFLQRAGNDIVAMKPGLNAATAGEDYNAGKLSAEDRKNLKALMDSYPQAFTLIEKAGDCSVYDLPIDYTANPSVVQAAITTDTSDFRAVVNLLEARNRVQVAEGRQHDALQTGLLLFRLARLYDGSGFIINNLVSSAARAVAVTACNRVLRAGPVTDADRQALEAELARHDGHAGFIQTLKKERVLGITSFDGLKNPLSRGWYDNDECHYLDLVQEQIDLADQPYDEFVKSTNQFKARGGVLNPLAKMWVPAAHKTREATERVRGLVRCLRVLNALQQAGVKAGDGEPKLADLKLPAGVTEDPFTGKPLLVKVVDGQWVIYTVGPDLKDDGGDLQGGKDFGVGPVPPLAK